MNFLRRKDSTESMQYLERQISSAQDLTTSFLTVTTLIYAIKAEITAAADIRLTL